MSGRPEHQAPPEIFYNQEEAQKYASSSRMIELQSQLSERCIELLLLPDHPCLCLDIGCGSGISGGVLSEMGHYWVGLDISPSMLEVAVDRECEGDLMLCDMGQGFRCRPGSFDGAISVSALQWLCNCDRKGQEPWKRLRTFFTSLFNCLKRGARAVLQFYPETAEQVETITAAALRCGFGGGLVVDYPHSAKAKKSFLVIYAGFTGELPAKLPKGLEDNQMDVDEGVKNEGRNRQKIKKKGKKNQATLKDKIVAKKEQQRRKGLKVREDTKYTGRKRKNRAF